jgi:hypothetical protein
MMPHSPAGLSHWATLLRAPRRHRWAAGPRFARGTHATLTHCRGATHRRRDRSRSLRPPLQHLRTPRRHDATCAHPSDARFDTKTRFGSGATGTAGTSTSPDLTSDERALGLRRGPGSSPLTLGRMGQPRDPDFRVFDIRASVSRQCRRRVLNRSPFRGCVFPTSASLEP